MKKMSKSASKRSQRSRLKKASSLRKFKSSQSKTFACKQNNDRETMEMTHRDVEKLRSLGYKVRILVEIPNSSDQLYYVRKVKGNVGIAAKSRKKSFANAKCCSQNGGGGDCSLDGDDGDCDGNMGGTSQPQSCASEKKFFVMILEHDEKRCKELERILAGLKEQDAKILKRLHEITVNEAQDDIEPNPKKKVFRRDIKDTMMAEAMYDVYEKIFGDEAKKKHENYDFSPIDLIAYLFIMVDIHQYGRPDFHYNGKRPFFEFFIENVKPELKGKRGITRETMGNRINKVFDCLYLTSEAKEKQTARTRSLNKRIEDNYQTVCGKFHKTRLGGILQKHK